VQRRAWLQTEFHFYHALLLFWQRLNLVGIIIGPDAKGILFFFLQRQGKPAIGVGEFLRARVIGGKLIEIERASHSRAEFRNWLS